MRLIKAVRNCYLCLWTMMSLMILSERCCSCVFCSRQFSVPHGSDSVHGPNYVHHWRSTSERTRHVKIRYFFIQHNLGANEITIEYLPTRDMVADLLTKPLHGTMFLKFWSLVTGTDHLSENWNMMELCEKWTRSIELRSTVTALTTLSDLGFR